MARKIEELTDREIQNFIKSYERENKTEGGIFSLAELQIEKLRRFPTERSPRDILKFILSDASACGTTTYQNVWNFLKPDTPWQGNHSIRIVGGSLGAVIAYCVRNRLPLASPLVVRSGTRKLSERAILNIYNEAKSYGLDVGLVPRDFVETEAEKARQLTLANLP